MNSSTPEQSLQRAQISLQGLSVGDAFGDQFFMNSQRIEHLIQERTIPAPPWSFTDDTVMAISVVDVLADRGYVDRDLLAELFSARYIFDRARGYGGTAHGILSRIAAGEHWRQVSAQVFGGTGSMGNGGAMRAAPIGAYFSHDLTRAAEAARYSAEVTHAHLEGQAGAVAIAVAAAWVAAGGIEPSELFAAVLAHTPDGETRAGIKCAAILPAEYDVRTAVSVLGNGTQLTSQDTVPFVLWCAAKHLGAFEEALWTTVSGLVDRDTTCAMVGGIVALHAAAKIPQAWLDARESLASMSRHRLARHFQNSVEIN
jgi:ADP-ribosylglycohydrolase